MKGEKKYVNVFYKENKFFSRLIIILSICIGISALTFFTYKMISAKILNSNSVAALYSNWNLNTQEGYEKVYQISYNILQKSPFHNAANTFHGYSCFMLAEREVENLKSLAYLDEGIFCLRKSLQNCKNQAEAQIKYMLARCYFYKNKISSYHFYSDLVIKYLEEAKILGFSSDDIPLLLGLSYADLGMTEKSISSFTEALLYKETDTLLFDIAKQYCNNNQGAAAKQYLSRVLSISENEDLIKAAEFLLGKIYFENEEYDVAFKEFEKVLAKDENHADSYYYIGNIYEHNGDLIKARFNWKKSLKIQPNHAGSLKKLAENK